MILISEKHNCCGCAACVQACPKYCISFEEDEQGFRYPLVDKSLCIDCGLCEKVCPVINQSESRKPQKVYAAKNPNEEIRLKSSSGGIFTILAESVINEGGVVFGARFDKNWEVEHGYTEIKEGIEAFRGSKYLQSKIGNTYAQARDFLRDGRKVLFSGTSCQIAGLKLFLRKDYNNLFTVDIVCHGVPSPLVWRTYLNDFKLRSKGVAGKNSVFCSLNEAHVITGISFREKSTGWKKFGFVIRGKSAVKADKNTVLSSLNTKENSDVLLHETLDKNLFMQVFLKNLCLRPSCSSCPAKSGKCGSDLTIADYWGIGSHHPEWDDDKGTSLVLVNSEKGQKFFSGLKVEHTETTYEMGYRGNPAIENSYNQNNYIQTFWDLFYLNGLQSVEIILRKFEPSILGKIMQLSKRILRKIV